MGSCARLSNYLQREIVHVAAVVNTVQSKGMLVMLLRVIENGQGPQKSRSERNHADDSSLSSSTEVARL